VAGAVVEVERPIAQMESAAILELAVYRRSRTPGPDDFGHRTQGIGDMTLDTVDEHRRVRIVIVLFGERLPVLQTRSEKVQAGDLGTRAFGDRPCEPQWSMCWCVMTTRPRSLSR